MVNDDWVAEVLGFEAAQSAERVASFRIAIGGMNIIYARNRCGLIGSAILHQRSAWVRSRDLGVAKRFGRFGCVDRIQIGLIRPVGSRWNVYDVRARFAGFWTRTLRFPRRNVFARLAIVAR